MLRVRGQAVCGCRLGARFPPLAKVGLPGAAPSGVSARRWDACGNGAGVTIRCAREVQEFLLRVYAVRGNRLRRREDRIFQGILSGLSAGAMGLELGVSKERIRQLFSVAMRRLGVSCITRKTWEEFRGDDPRSYEDLP